VLHRAGAGEALRVVDDQRGSPTWSEDLAPLLVTLAVSSHVGTFHATNSGDCTWWELASHVVRSSGLAATVEKVSTADLGRPAARPAYSVLSNHLVERVTGDRMPHWRDAVDRYLATRVQA
jgi:dTDP-4-dehydrorhamnose reductase